MTEPARHLADEVARAGHPVYFYRFSYVAELTRGKMKGALHSSEIPYVFNIPAEVFGDKVTGDDKKMGELASAYWVSFAKTGDPNGGNRPQWPRHDPAVDKVIDFTNNGVVVGPDPLKARLDLWRKVWSQDQSKTRPIKTGPIMALPDAAQELMIFVVRTLPGYLCAQTLWDRSND